MTKKEMIAFGINSVFDDLTDYSVDDTIEKYPFNYEKNVSKSITNSWKKVGNDLKKAINQYDDSTMVH